MIKIYITNLAIKTFCLPSQQRIMILNCLTNLFDYINQFSPQLYALSLCSKLILREIRR